MVIAEAADCFALGQCAFAAGERGNALLHDRGNALHHDRL